MIDQDLHNKLSSMTKTSLGEARLSVIQRLIDASVDFKDGRITERMYIAVALAVNGVVNSMPSRPGVTVEETEKELGKLRDDTDAKLRARLAEL